MKGMLVIRHNRGCRALEAVKQGDWQTPWCCPQLIAPGREKTGKPHRGSGVKFLAYRCNDPDCDAQIIFLAETLERMLGLRPAAKTELEEALDDFWSDLERDVGWEAKSETY